jgi:hypothetical protein
MERIQGQHARIRLQRLRHLQLMIALVLQLRLFQPRKLQTTMLLQAPSMDGSDRSCMGPQLNSRQAAAQAVVAE